MWRAQSSSSETPARSSWTFLIIVGRYYKSDFVDKTFYRERPHDSYRLVMERFDMTCRGICQQIEKKIVAN